MFKIFDMTQKQLKKYVGSGMEGLHTQVVSDGKILWGRAKDIGSKVGTAIGWIKKK